MNKKKLAIKIKKGKQKNVNQTANSSSSHRHTPAPFTDSEEEELAAVDTGPKSAEIQVVYDKELPNLHGILKQRSMSESSDDLGSSSCSPASPRDELFGFKKSVKFNDRIDSTSFRSGSAVTSMTTALKSKRRRNRKKEEKKHGRQRQNSGGSEGTSSGEEMELRQTSLTEEDIEEETDCNHIIDEILELESKNLNEEITVKENSGSIVKETSQLNSESTKIALEDGEKSQGDEILEKENDVPTNKEMSQPNSKSVEEKVIKNIKEKLLQEKSQGSRDDSDDDGDVIDNDQNEKLDYRTKSDDRGNAAETKLIKELDDKHVTQNGKQNNSGMEGKQNGDDSGVESGLDGGGDLLEKTEDDKVKTSLSWEENAASNQSIDLATQDHRTQCAFKFSNAIMFDLDVD